MKFFLGYEDIYFSLKNELVVRVDYFITNNK